MNVSHILASKGRLVVTTAPHRTLSEAINLLCQKGIGALVVAGHDGSVLGILSERDVIRVLARNGTDALQDAVSKHMTTRVVTATDNTSITAAMQQMTGGRFRHMPVLEGDRLAGLVSIGDVVKHRLEQIEHEKQSILDYIATA